MLCNGIPPKDPLNRAYAAHPYHANHSSLGQPALTGTPHWLAALGTPAAHLPDGLVSAQSIPTALAPEARAIVERAAQYGAQYVFFQAAAMERAAAVALVFIDDSGDDAAFAALHRRPICPAVDTCRRRRWARMV